MLHSESARRIWTVHVDELSVADHAGLPAIGRAYRRALRHDRRITLRGASPALQSALTRVHLVHRVLGNDGPPTAGGPTEP
jgi:anti-anti-sigma regulatory factor